MGQAGLAERSADRSGTAARAGSLGGWLHQHMAPNEIEDVADTRETGWETAGLKGPPRAFSRKMLDPERMHKERAAKSAEAARKKREAAAEQRRKDEALLKSYDGTSIGDWLKQHGGDGMAAKARPGRRGPFNHFRTVRPTRSRGCCAHLGAAAGSSSGSGSSSSNGSGA